MALEVGQRFTFRDGQHTISTGVITKLLPNLTDEQKELMTLNKEKKVKFMEAKAVKATTAKAAPAAGKAKAAGKAA